MPKGDQVGSEDERGIAAILSWRPLGAHRTLCRDARLPQVAAPSSWQGR